MSPLASCSSVDLPRSAGARPPVRFTALALLLLAAGWPGSTWPGGAFSTTPALAVVLAPETASETASEPEPGTALETGEHPPASSADAAFPQGVAAGDPTSTSIVLWTRTAEPARLRLSVWVDDAAGGPSAGEIDPSSDAFHFDLPEAKDGSADGTISRVVEGLRPATPYRYRFSHPAAGVAIDGRFRTAPADDALALPSFVVGGDLGGQALCRHAERGYDIFQAMAAVEPHFLVANGDMIYADNPCPASGPMREGQPWPNVPGDFPGIGDVDWTVPGEAREAIDAHWRYNRADPHHRAFLASTPYFAQWDDHEVVNDFGLPWARLPIDPEREGFPALAHDALEAFFDWNPIRPSAEEPRRIYRSYRWGRELELFLLDGRSYRSSNDVVDTPENAKVLLGDAQRRWLIEGLRRSEATWKVVSSDVPLSIPTGWRADLTGRDAFANGTDDDFSKRTGSERELLALLAELDRHDVENLVVVVTDVHLAANLRYARDFDGDGEDLVFHELINGPLNAYTAPTLAKLDPTLQPTILYAEGGFFNFSYVRLERGPDGQVRLVAEIRDRHGNVRHGSRLELEPAR